jgi:3-oxoacyl-[acyl-carrier-protein] synthase-1
MQEAGFLCASANIEELDPEAGDLPILQQREDNLTIDTVMSNSFGFGGTNACLVFQRLKG